MGYVDVYQDYCPIGLEERLDDEQKALEKKAIQRIRAGDLKNLGRMIKAALVSGAVEPVTAAIQGLESQGAATDYTSSAGAMAPAETNPGWAGWKGWIMLILISIAILAWMWRKMKKMEARMTALEFNQGLHAVLIRDHHRELTATLSDHAVSMLTLEANMTTMWDGFHAVARQRNAPFPETPMVVEELPRDGVEHPEGMEVQSVQEIQKHQDEPEQEGLAVEDLPEEAWMDHSPKDSEWYPGQSEDQENSDRQMWLDELRHIEEYERRRGPLNDMQAVQELLNCDYAAETAAQGLSEEVPAAGDSTSRRRPTDREALSADTT